VQYTCNYEAKTIVFNYLRHISTQQNNTFTVIKLHEIILKTQFVRKLERCVMGEVGINDVSLSIVSVRLFMNFHFEDGLGVTFIAC